MHISLKEGKENMQQYAKSTDLLDIKCFTDSGVRKIQRALIEKWNGYEIDMVIGNSREEHQRSAHSVSLLSQDPVCIIGTSFAVPYFNDRKRFRAIAQFLTQFSKQLVWMIPDEPFVSTCRAREMQEDEIKQKVAHYTGSLTTKVKYAEFGIKEMNVESNILTWDVVCQMPTYAETLKMLSLLYESREDFKKDVDRIVCKTLANNINNVDENKIKIAKDFLLKELSCIFSVGKTLNRPVLYVYHEPWDVPILEKIVAGYYGIIEKNEIGVLIIKASNCGK